MKNIKIVFKILFILLLIIFILVTITGNSNTSDITVYVPEVLNLSVTAYLEYNNTITQINNSISLYLTGLPYNLIFQVTNYGNVVLNNLTVVTELIGSPIIYYQNKTIYINNLAPLQSINITYTIYPFYTGLSQFYIAFYYNNTYLASEVYKVFVFGPPESSPPVVASEKINYLAIASAIILSLLLLT